MKTLSTFFGAMLGLALLGALAAGGYFALKFGFDLFGTLEPQVATMTAIASVVVLLCASIIAGGFKWTGRKEAEVQVRADKSNLYERVLLIWGEKLSHRMQAMAQATADELLKLERLLTLRGNSRVIKAYVALQALEKKAGLPSPEIPSQVAKVLLEMRKDLGQDVLSLNESDLVNLLNVEVLQDRPASISQVGRPQVSLSQGT
jgi:hypothetical protein